MCDKLEKLLDVKIGSIFILPNPCCCVVVDVVVVVVVDVVVVVVVVCCVDGLNVWNVS